MVRTASRDRPGSPVSSRSSLMPPRRHSRSGRMESKRDGPFCSSELPQSWSSSTPRRETGLDDPCSAEEYPPRSGRWKPESVSRAAVTVDLPSQPDEGLDAALGEERTGSAARDRDHREHPGVLVEDPHGPAPTAAPGRERSSARRAVALPFAAKHSSEFGRLGDPDVTSRNASKALARGTESSSSPLRKGLQPAVCRGDQESGRPRRNELPHHRGHVRVAIMPGAHWLRSACGLAWANCVAQGTHAPSAQDPDGGRMDFHGGPE